MPNLQDQDNRAVRIYTNEFFDKVEEELMCIGDECKRKRCDACLKEFQSSVGRPCSLYKYDALISTLGDDVDAISPYIEDLKKFI